MNEEIKPTKKSSSVLDRARTTIERKSVCEEKEKESEIIILYTQTLSAVTTLLQLTHVYDSFISFFFLTLLTYSQCN